MNRSVISALSTILVLAACTRKCPTENLNGKYDLVSFEFGWKDFVDGHETLVLDTKQQVYSSEFISPTGVISRKTGKFILIDSLFSNTRIRLFRYTPLVANYCSLLKTENDKAGKATSNFCEYHNLLYGPFVLGGPPDHYETSIECTSSEVNILLNEGMNFKKFR